MYWNKFGKTVKEKGKEIEKFFFKNIFAECPRVSTRQSIVFAECLIGLTLGKNPGFAECRITDTRQRPDRRLNWHGRDSLTHACTLPSPRSLTAPASAAPRSARHPHAAAPSPALPRSCPPAVLAPGALARRPRPRSRLHRQSLALRPPPSPPRTPPRPQRRAAPRAPARPRRPLPPAARRLDSSRPRPISSIRSPRRNPERRLRSVEHHLGPSVLATISGTVSALCSPGNS